MKKTLYTVIKKAATAYKTILYNSTEMPPCLTFRLDQCSKEKYNSTFSQTQAKTKCKFYTNK